MRVQEYGCVYVRACICMWIGVSCAGFFTTIISTYTIHMHCTCTCMLHIKHGHGKVAIHSKISHARFRHLHMPMAVV